MTHKDSNDKNHEGREVELPGEGEDGEGNDNSDGDGARAAKKG